MYAIGAGHVLHDPRLADKAPLPDGNVGWPVVVAITHPKMGANHPSWAGLPVWTWSLANALPDDPTGQIALIQVAPS